MINDAGGTADRIELAAGITSGQVTLTRSTNHLVIGISGGANTLTVNNWYANAGNRIETIRLADGAVITLGTAAPLSVAIVQTKENMGAMRVPGGKTSGRRSVEDADVWAAASTQGVDQQVNALVEAMAQFGSSATEAEALIYRAPPREPVWVVPAA